LKDNYRSFPEMGGGCFYDLGTYWVQFVQYILGMNYDSFYGSSEFNGPNGCDWSFNAGLIWKVGVKAQFETSFEQPYQASHVLEFENGRVKIDNFFKANYGNFKIFINEKDFISGARHKTSFPPQNYYVNQLNFFCDVLDGKNMNISLKESHERVKLMDDILNAARMGEAPGRKS